MSDLPTPAVRVDRFAIPSTVSPEAAEKLKLVYGFLSRAAAPVRPESLDDWDRNRAQAEAFALQLGQPVIEALRPHVSEGKLGGIPVFRVRPAGWQPTGRTLIFIHGGGYVTGTARGSISEVAHMAQATSDEVVVLGYSTAPRGQWRQVTGEVLAAWRALLDEGATPGNVGLYGGSAGGGLAAGAVLRMRDEDLPLPGALYLQAPWSDITATGDTIGTLADSEPLLTSESLAWGADAYADRADQRHPYVSPVYGDYGRAFPPTLIQVGTREMFLSHAVRLYQAIRGGGHDAVLDVYEGMPHGFPALFMDTPEGRTAIDRAAHFFNDRLRGATRD